MRSDAFLLEMENFLNKESDFVSKTLPSYLDIYEAYMTDWFRYGILFELSVELSVELITGTKPPLVGEDLLLSGESFSDFRRTIWNHDDDLKEMEIQFLEAVVERQTISRLVNDSLISAFEALDALAIVTRSLVKEIAQH